MSKCIDIEEKTRMKRGRWIGLTGLLAVVLLLVGCGGGSEGQALAPEAASASSALDASYEGALALRNQLALGTLRLEETDQPVTEAQADELLLLWQTLRSTMDSGTSAQAEVDALLAQIEGTMSGEQLAAIGAMRLTQDDMQIWAQSNSLNMTQGSGLGSGEHGSGRDLSEDERATRQAERQASGDAGSGISRALIDAVIALLQAK
jgi:hypothetical protein